MLQNFEVRFARREDWQAIKEAERRIIKILEKKGIREWYLGNISQMLDSEESQCIIAKKNGELLGVLVLDTEKEKMVQEVFPRYKPGTGLRVVTMILLPSKCKEAVLSSLVEYGKGYAEENAKNCIYGLVHPRDVVVKRMLGRHMAELYMTEETLPVRLGNGIISHGRPFLGRWIV